VVIVNETNSVIRKFPDFVEVEADGTVILSAALCRSIHPTVTITIVSLRPAIISYPTGGGSLPAQRSNVCAGSRLDKQRAQTSGWNRAIDYAARLDD